MPKRHRKDKSERPVIGVGWLDRAQWEALTKVVDDRNFLDDTFEDWERNALKALKTLEARGAHVERVPVVVSHLVTWCKRNGLPMNGASRARYVSHLLSKGSK